ncbi:putative saf4/Yju2 protein [Helianthus anomalus]
MPYNIWCGGCSSMIAKGVRFNAEKKQVGNCYSTNFVIHHYIPAFLTQIWSFTMKSACCQHEVVIQTNPKNCEYLIISGAQKKFEEFDTDDAETMVLPVDEGFKEEKRSRAITSAPSKRRVSDARHFVDYSINKSLRAKLRLAARKMGLGIRLLPASEEDTAAAKCVKFSSNFVINLSNEWLRHII